MISLESLVKENKYNDRSDLEIIIDYFKLNNIEERGVEVSNELAKCKIEKMKEDRLMIDTWLPHIPFEYLYENYDIEIASKLHRLELDYIINNGVIKSKCLTKWFKENARNIEMPTTYFVPCLHYLFENGIKFKE